MPLVKLTKTRNDPPIILLIALQMLSCVLGNWRGV